MHRTEGRRGRAWIASLACVLALTGAACSDDPKPSEEPAASGDGHNHEHDVGEAVDNFEFALGKPGDEAAATRTVEVETKPGFKFAPEGVRVEAGETVTFTVTNTDKVDHEFVLGNKPYQDLHESQVEAGGVYHNYSDYSVHVQPGDTQSFTWTFDTAGRILFACHVAGHYKAGMVGEITIS